MPKPKNLANWANLQKCTREGYQLVMQGLASIVRVAQSDDLKLVLAAGEYLVEYGENLMRQKAAAQIPTKRIQLQSREDILLELRGLYAKALGEAPAIVDTAVIPEDQPISRD